MTTTYPDGGVEQFQYSTLGVMAYTNQLGKVTRYGYDSAGRKIAETNANAEVIRYAYSPANDMIMLIDGKNQTNQWQYDQYGRMTNQIDALGNSAFVFKYDALGRMTNRWTPGKGNVYYAYDRSGNLTNVHYAASHDLGFYYDGLNRVTNMVDAAGTTAFTFTAVGTLASEDGPWTSDTVSYGYNADGLRTNFSLQMPYSTAWGQTYLYDPVLRLTNIVSPAGSFTYDYSPGVSSATSASSLLRKVGLPNGMYITNAFDGNARLLSTKLRNIANVDMNSHAYAYNQGNQRSQQTRLDGSYVNYSYDNIGQLATGVGKESGGAVRKNENLGYGYDAAGNLAYRTNNALVQTWSVDSLNQLSSETPSGTVTVKGTTTSAASSVSVNGSSAYIYGDNTFALDGFGLSTTNYTAIASDSYGRSDTNSITVVPSAGVTFAYDSNGNLTSDGNRGFDYDDENQLLRVTVTNNWKSEFTYDGQRRRRIRKEYSWLSSAWVQTAEIHYVYDGNLVVQERDGNNVPLVTYTRGLDMSGSMQGAGGIGGLLARSDHSSMPATHAYYHADGNGNVTELVNGYQAVVAKYLYDAYGNILSQSGPLADANLYRFSSKEAHVSSGLVYYGYRFYEPNLQRWLNRDPIGMAGGQNQHVFAANTPIGHLDPLGESILSDFNQFSALNLAMLQGQIAANSAQGYSPDSLGYLRNVEPETDPGVTVNCGIDSPWAAPPSINGGSWGGRMVRKIGWAIVDGITWAVPPERAFEGVVTVCGWARGAKAAKAAEEAQKAAAIKKLLGPGIVWSIKIEGQLAKRGWTKALVEDAIANPARTAITEDWRRIAPGAVVSEPATAYFSRRGGYVVRNNRTGEIVQISDRTDPNWLIPFPLQ